MNLREVARGKVKAAKAKADSQQPKYRDRASERRVMHNQPDIPMPEGSSKLVTKKKAEGPPPPPSPPAAPVNPGEDEKNVGNKLLKMMGWREGTGLGTDGEGIVEPMYVPCIFMLYWELTLMFSKPNGNLRARSWAWCQQR